jgi:hypothetical protein
MLAAAVALFAAGMLTGRAVGDARAPEPGAPRFALLLYGGPPGADDAEEAARVDEYRRWARGLAARGHHVSGEKLGDEAIELAGGGTAPLTSPPAGEAGSLAGFFLVSATSAAEAELIARSCPHLRYGGRVVVRPVAPT